MFEFTYCTRGGREIQFEADVTMDRDFAILGVDYYLILPSRIRSIPVDETTQQKLFGILDAYLIEWHTEDVIQSEIDRTIETASYHMEDR